MIRKSALIGTVAGMVAWMLLTPLSGAATVSSSGIHLAEDPAVTLRFFGPPAADLFTRELDASFQGVLKESFYAQARDGHPAGFVSASLPGFPWAGTMWSRDGGTFMRELVMRGYYQHADLLAECLMHLVEKDQNGFYSFPEYFKGSQPGAGEELAILDQCALSRFAAAPRPKTLPVRQLSVMVWLSTHVQHRLVNSR